MFFLRSSGDVDYHSVTEGDDVWVAQDRGRIVGFASIYRDNNFIHNLFVSLFYQGRRIGTQFLQMAESHLARPMTLKIALDNVKVCGFYEKQEWFRASLHEEAEEPYVLYQKGERNHEHRFYETYNSSDLDFLSDKIHEETVGFGEWTPFAFFVRNDEGGILAGCNGSVIFGVIYTDQLWVHSDHRKTGLGRQLMERVHAYGREKQCRMATVCTMSFQGAQAFYEHLGYGVRYQQTGYINDASCFFLSRDLGV